MAAALPPGDPRPVNQHPRTVIGIDRRAARIHINADDLSAAFALQCRILSPAADMIRHTAKGLNRKHPAAALPQISCRLRTDQPAVPDRRLKSDHISAAFAFSSGSGGSEKNPASRSAAIMRRWIAQSAAPTARYPAASAGTAFERCESI